MSKPGERANRYEKKLYPLWVKTRGQPRRVPPDDVLIELYEILSIAVIHEYARHDLQKLSLAPAVSLTFNQSFAWFATRFHEWRDIYRQHWYICEVVVVPGLGGGDHKGDTNPDYAKLREGARHYAALRDEYRFWKSRFERATLPPPFADYWPKLREHSAYLPNHLDNLPQSIDRHVKLRRTLGHWDEESCRTLLCGVRPDFENFDKVTADFFEECKVLARAECARHGRVFKE